MHVIFESCLLLEVTTTSHHTCYKKTTTRAIIFWILHANDLERSWFGMTFEHL